MVFKAYGPYGVLPRAHVLRGLYPLWLFGCTAYSLCLIDDMLYGFLWPMVYDLYGRWPFSPMAFYDLWPLWPIAFMAYSFHGQWPL